MAIINGLTTVSVKRRTFHERSFLGVNLSGTEPTGQLGGGFIPLKGGQGHLGVEHWSVLLPRLLLLLTVGHFRKPDSLLASCLVFEQHLTHLRSAAEAGNH